MITNHEFQAGEYSPRAGRRVCAICNETQGSKFHKAAEVYVSDEGDQGYGDWLESIEDGVSATLKARHSATCLLCERETVPAHGDTCPECDAWLNERREALGIEL